MPTFNGTTGPDILEGTSGDDVINARAGNDIINGGLGADEMHGDEGDDTFYVDNAGDSVFELYNGGDDIVYSTVSFALGSQYIETLVLTGGDNVTATGNGLDNVLTGNYGNNVLNGSLGADRMNGGTGDDTYFVDNAGDLVTELFNGGNDLVYSTVSFNLGSQYIERLSLIGTANINATGNGLDNILVGNTGDNILNGSAGADAMYGGAGNDVYFVDNAGDAVFELYNQGNDVLYSTVSYVLGGQYIETLALIGTANISATGNGLNNYLIGNAGNNILNGSIGADYMAGGAGDDWYFVDDAADTVVELDGAGNDVLYATVSYTLTGQSIESFVLQGSANINATGDANNNVITGNLGRNLIDGGAGADIMRGGGGDDTFIVDNLNDVVQSSGVFSTIRVLVDGYTLAPSIYYAEMLGNVVSLYGTTAKNVITGNAVGNLIDGKGGGDTMTGGLGDDTYYVYGANDLVVETADQGHDTVFSAITYTLTATVEDLVLTGGASIGTGNTLDNHLTGNAGNNMLYGMDGSDVIEGGDGNDRLDGGSGSDTMEGGAGDDTYYATPDDIINEHPDEGNDTIAYSTSYTLMAGDNLENIILLEGGTATGNDQANILSGTGLASTLNGLGGNDTLQGSVSGDYLDGGSGADAMSGGNGNDTYYVDNANDTVVESPSQGTDLVYASVSFALGANVDNLTLTGTADINATGNGDKNILIGNDGNNILNDGGGGGDTLSGGKGDDSYYVFAGGGTWPAPTIHENADEGVDTIYVSGGSLDVPDNVENIVLLTQSGISNGNALANTMTGSTRADYLYGGGGNDVLYGNDGADRLDGEAGDDTLNGGSGDDILVGRDGADTFVFSTGSGNDSITDFSTAEHDVIDVTAFGLSSAPVVTQNGGNAIVHIDGVNTILVVGASATDPDLLASIHW